jgi:tRNA U34 5-carboxymethylaminomethyl modifying GTPase MnmE/TrmE
MDLLRLCPIQLKYNTKFLGEITGEVTAKNNYSRIFGKFCIGK